MKTLLKWVKEFHKRNKFSLNSSFYNDDSVSVDFNLHELSKRISAHVALIEEMAISQQDSGYPGLYRLCLILEEVSELLNAARSRNLIEYADALGDLSYVVAGTALTYGIDLHKVCKEVHLSNMSKKIKTDDDPRMRCKGPKYHKPDLSFVLKGVKDANIRRS